MKRRPNGKDACGAEMYFCACDICGENFNASEAQGVDLCETCEKRKNADIGIEIQKRPYADVYTMTITDDAEPDAPFIFFLDGRDVDVLIGKLQKARGKFQ